MRQELTYGNRLSVRRYKDKMLRKAMSDVAVGQVMVLKIEEAHGRITYFACGGSVEKGEKSVIYDDSRERPHVSHHQLSGRAYR